ncbi:hypothetical protein AB0G05_27010 [Nonomuraea wenchangensis]|uniref:hypothetical protein n=1 Tax=Nonomuraea bangladeshensis TaxID=404385 RepID=UPI0034774FA9
MIDRTATAITFPRKTIEDWAGRNLTEAEMAQLNKAIANSGIPETIAALVAAFRPTDAATFTQALANMTTRISDDLDRFLHAAVEGNLLTFTATPAHNPEAEPEEGFTFCAVVAEATPDGLDEGPLDVLATSPGRVRLNLTDFGDIADLSDEQALQAATQLITAVALSRRHRR